MVSPLDMPPEEVEIPFSILDTDLYKLTMQYAVLKHFHDAHVTIKFTNRTSTMLFSRDCFDWIQEKVLELSKLRLDPKERTKLAHKCPYFPASYLDYLSSIQLRPDKQVRINFVPKGTDGLGEIECFIEGLWRDVILYEVPLLAIFSEGYFKFVDTDWTMDGVQEKAKGKAKALLNPPSPQTGVAFSEFGTRRRRSFQVQDLVLRGLVQGYEEAKAEASTMGRQCGVLSGTSNSTSRGNQYVTRQVYLALKYGLQPIGTIAHEWIMAIGATYGYRGANGRAMDMWEEVYPRGPGAPPLTMLTDTYTIGAFFVDFTSDPARALKWGALRHDSGDPLEFVEMAKKAWTTVEAKSGVQPGSGPVANGKMAVFSDSLDVDKALRIKAKCDDMGMGASFGIGTFLTNDFVKASEPSTTSQPLNIVIKLNKIDGKDCVKLSDDIGKYTGNVEEVKRVQEALGLNPEHQDESRG